MIRIKDFSGLDRVSVALATAVLSLMSSLALSAASSPSAIPGQFLDRVRGATPKFTAVINPTLPNCSYLQAADDTAAGTPTVQGFGGCNSGNIGTACVTCPLQRNYQLSMVNPPPPGVFTTPFPATCDNPPGGSAGTCQMIGTYFSCNLMTGYDCDQYAFTYDAEPPR